MSNHVGAQGAFKKGALCTQVIRLPSFQSSKRRYSWSKLAHVHEQSEFTHNTYLVAAGHLNFFSYELGWPRHERIYVYVYVYIYTHNVHTYTVYI